MLNLKNVYLTFVKIIQNIIMYNIFMRNKLFKNKLHNIELKMIK